MVHHLRGPHLDLLPALLIVGCLSTTAHGQRDREEPPDAVRRVRASLELLDGVTDYQCTLQKRERIRGKLSERESMKLRLRHEPFSVYVRYQLPKRLDGQEVLYVDGRNDGKMLAHPAGLRGRIVGTVALKTTGRIAMEGNRYPITELGVRRMAESWLREYQRDSKLVPCDTRALQGAKINGRPSTCLEAVRRKRHREAPFQQTNLFIDDELGLPVRYEAYEWPTDPSGKPLLAEEYSYLELRLDNGFTDADFDESNREYGFR
ncbi:MAG TPA: DUF1571 domain-containing protein [Pirellulales bacterium]|nr:DUF1571 domain-containing protein [Pirellulales bacterium]